MADSSATQSVIFLLTTALLIPLLSATLYFFWVDPFDPAPIPLHELVLNNGPAIAPRVNSRILRESELIGSGRVSGPEDLAYEPSSGVVYTGCEDGWVKRVKVGGFGSGEVVEDWVNTGGRPFGLAIATDGGGGYVVVADAHKGLLKITQDKQIKLLTDEAEGQRFKLTDEVVIANDGMIYFTDASYKYSCEDYLYDILESRPHGRLLMYNPNTGETKVILRDLYFPNGLAISPDQNSLIFCETPLKRCKRYWLQGTRMGSVESFIDNLPGFPDNIHYDGHNEYLIAISSWPSPYLERVRRHQLARKSMAILNRYISLRFLQKYGGIFSVDLQGNPTAHFYDPSLSLISSGIRVDDRLYIGSLKDQHIISFNLSSHDS